MDYNITKTMDCDIVVLGGGGAGLVAAARAAGLSDKKIIVVEKGTYSGGGAKAAGDFRVYGSKWQKERGLDDALNTDLLKFMDLTNWKLDRELVLRTFLATGEFFDWVCTLGEDVSRRWVPGRYIFDFPDQGPIIPTYSGLPEEREKKTPPLSNESFPEEGDKIDPTDGLMNPGAGPMMPTGMRSGTYIMKLMSEECEKRQASVLLKHKVVDVEVADGKISAAIVESPEGLIKINCKVCILATGSWINNQKYLEMASPQYAKLDSGPLLPGGHRNRNYTGDGIAIAEKVGAYVDYDSFCIRPMGPSPKGTHGLPMPKSQTVNAMSRHPYALQINALGKRYTCEPSSVRLDLFESAHIALNQPEAKTFLVFDRNTVYAAAKNFKPSGGGIFGAIRLPDDIEADLASDGSIMKSDTVAGLAEKMGMDPKALEETIAKYNASCEAGFDSDCFKPNQDLVPLTGSYFAVECEIGTDGAFGGVLVNADIQAYKKGGGLVEGLYVPGDFSSGRFINDMGIKRQVINDLSWAFASGFIAAESAVRYLSETCN